MTILAQNAYHLALPVESLPLCLSGLPKHFRGDGGRYFDTLLDNLLRAAPGGPLHVANDLQSNSSKPPPVASEGGGVGQTNDLFSNALTDDVQMDKHSRPC